MHTARHFATTDLGDVFVFEFGGSMTTFNSLCFEDGQPLLRRVEYFDCEYFPGCPQPDGTVKPRLVVVMEDGIRLEDSVNRQDTLQFRHASYRWLAVRSPYGSRCSARIFGFNLEGHHWASQDLPHRSGPIDNISLGTDGLYVAEAGRKLVKRHFTWVLDWHRRSIIAQWDTATATSR